MPTIPTPTLPPSAAVPAPPSSPPSTTCLLRADFLYWWTQNLPTPPLVTTSRHPVDLGIIGKPTTKVLAGGPDGIEFPALLGVRAEITRDVTELCGIHAGGFYLANGGRYVTFTRQTLAIPYVDPVTMEPTSVVLSTPYGPTGYASIQTFGQLWNAEAHGTLRLYDDTVHHLEFLLGGRVLGLMEDLRLWTYTQSSQETFFQGQSQPAGTAYSALNQFEARNRFYGGQAGLRHRHCSGRCTLDTTISVAVGMTHQEMNINGNTNLNIPPQHTTLGNVFAQTSNLGRYTRDVFAVVPQGRVALGYEILELVRVSVGFDVLYWSGVVRPASQINPLVYPSLIPGQGNNVIRAGDQPLLRYDSTDYWVLGLSLGAEIAF